MESIVWHPQYNESTQDYDFALLQMDLPVHHLDIQIWEDSLDDKRGHETDHDDLVSTYGYVTGSSYCFKLLLGALYV